MIQLYLNDCIAAMKKLPNNSVDMLFTDLPYGSTKCKWDTPINLDDFWKEVDRVVKKNGCKALFAQAPFDKVLACSNIKDFRYEWIWEKTTPTGHLNSKRMPMKAHENILIFYKKLPTYNPQMTHGHKRKVSTVEHKRNCKKTDIYNDYSPKSYDSTDRFPRDVLRGPTDKQLCALHPTQKPVWLCEYMVKTYTNEGETVLDCCMGSASIGVACQNTNRNYIGIDNSKQWYDVAHDRLHISNNQKTAENDLVGA